ncbi:alpha-1,2-fucosyltransferase [Patescibacteria group bacterium]|nr:alpha-1,2-fucosyltransferase [Patescibacteria group bacterium]
MNKIIIINSPGRMANKLHLYASIYAYCLEKEYKCANYDFKKFKKYFNIPAPKFNLKTEILKLLIKIATRIKFLSFLKNAFLEQIIDGSQEFLLSPDTNNNVKQKEILARIDKSSNKNYYFNGWLFRSYVGIEKYHAEIKEYFKPRQEYLALITQFINELKNKYKLIIGVHIQQGDYKTWRLGEYFFNFSQINNILNELQNNLLYKKEEIIFVLCSDEAIEKNKFINLNFVKGLGNEISDLYTLSECDLIIGSNSTYNAWAAYYGRKPRVIFSKEKINWTKALSAINLKNNK